MLKTLIVYSHLLAACVAVGILLIQDLELMKTKGKVLSVSASKNLMKSANIIFVALVVLWISGLALVLIGHIENPQQYLMNQKLWAKFTVVSILSLNGIALHYFSLPRVVNHGVLGVSTLQQILVMLTGALSSTSWLFACFLGIARPWNYTADYSFVMFIYAGLVVTAFIVSGEVLRAMRNAKFENPVQSEPPVLTERIHLVSSRRFE